MSGVDPSPEDPPKPGFLVRLKTFTQPRTAAARRARMAAGLLLMAGVIWWSVASFPDSAGFSWGWIVYLLVVGGPAMLLVMVLEQHNAAKLSRANVTIASSARTALAATAANYLPLPGAAIVRVEALRRAGTKTTTAIAVAMAMGLLWLGYTGLGVGIALLWRPWLLVALAVIGASGVGLAIVVWSLSKNRNISSRAIVMTSIVMLGKVVLHGINTYAGIKAIGGGPSLVDGMVVSSATVISSAVGFVPGGLGLREGLAGLLSAASGLPASVGALAAVVTRSVMTLLIGLLASILLLRRRSAQPLSGSDPDTA